MGPWVTWVHIWDSLGLAVAAGWMIPGRFRDVITKRTVYANNAGTNPGEMSTEPVDIKSCEAIEQESEIHRC